MDQHPVAGARRVGEVAQRAVPDAAFGAGGDDRREERVAT
jgi:hypothetical protein